MKRITRMALAVAMLLFATAGFALTTSSPASAHEEFTNGCTYIQDSGVFWDFHNACDWHDLCYHYHWKGEGEDGRQGCDDTFKQIMLDWCSNRWENIIETTYRGWCYGWAETVYGAVRIGAQSHF